MRLGQWSESGGRVVNHDPNNGRTVAAVLTDMKDELKDFVSTRLALFKAEVNEKLKTLKIAVPLAATGLALLLTAYLLLTLALVALVFAFLPDNAYRWCLAFVILGVLWAILGGVAAWFAKRELELRGLIPKKTIRVLKDDKIWIQSEVNNQV